MSEPSMPITVTIAARYCGPPESANGGYVAGLLAKHLSDADDVPVEVTLRAPPPLEQSLSLVVADGSCRLMDGEVLVAEARVVPESAVDMELPEAPMLTDAEKMSEHYVGFDRHPFPTCFVCGPERAEGDGLRIFPGRLSGTSGPVAGPFRADASFVVDGKLSREVVWAALDCPGYFGSEGAGESALLGRITAVVHRLPRVDERLVVVGFPLGHEGRKLFAGSALFDAEGEPVAWSRQVWIRLA